MTQIIPKHKLVYRYQVIYSDKEKKQTLEIIDLFDEANPTMSVTNGIEYVLKEIQQEIGFLPGNIIYRDTDGEWDRIIATKDGQFARFASL